MWNIVFQKLNGESGEALLQDDRITAVENFEFTVNKKQVLTTFTVVSIFGEINTEMGVEI